MNRSSLYQYFLLLFVFSIVSELFVIRIPVSIRFELAIFDFFLLLVFNPLSWAVYSVYNRRGAGFKHLGVLDSYEIILVLIAFAVQFNTPYRPFFNGSVFVNAPVVFLLLNLLNPISWIVIYYSVDLNKYRRPQRTAQMPPSPGFSQQNGGVDQTVSTIAPESTRQEMFEGPSERDVNVSSRSGQATSLQGTPVKTSAESQTGNDVTLVGYVGGGKTTFTALFVHVAQFIEGIPGFDVILEKSSPVVRQGIEKLLQGEWPSLTLRSEYRTQTSITMRRKSKLGTKKVSLTINDVSGEIWREIAEQSDNPGPRLEQLIKENPSVKSLINARKYLITISCSDFLQWETAQLHFLDLFRTIRALNGGKIVRKPTAVIFTKVDLLPLDLRDVPAEKLMKDYLPYIYSYVKEFFDQNEFDFFRVGVKINEMNKPDVHIENNKHRLTVLGGGSIGQFPDIVRWMFD